MRLTLDGVNVVGSICLMSAVGNRGRPLAEFLELILCGCEYGCSGELISEWRSNDVWAVKKYMTLWCCFSKFAIMVLTRSSFESGTDVTVRSGIGWKMCLWTVSIAQDLVLV